MNEKNSEKLYCWPIWADLPADLLVEISKCLRYSFQVGHFRAVCTTWRSAVPLPPHTRLSRVSKYSPNKESEAVLMASKFIRRLVFRLQPEEIPPSSSPPPPSPTSYLVAVEEHYDGDGQSKLRLLNPITGSPIPVSSNLFPREINLNKFRVSILHKSSFINLLPHTIHRITLKVVRLSTAGQSFNGRYPKPTAALGDGKLTLVCIGGKVILNDLMDSLLRDHNLNKPIYDDVVKYKKKWFAIDQYGRGVMVDSSSKVILVTNPLFLPDSTGYYRYHKTSLVKSSGDADLFLVDRYYDETSDYDPEEPDFEMPVRFRVYKLEEEEQCWKEVTSLNDQAIFVGGDAYLWSYCVCVKDFPECRGNFIYFTEQLKRAKDGDLPDFCDALKHERKHYIGGFHMENAISGPMACFPGYTDFFWPPPTWLS